MKKYFLFILFLFFSYVSFSQNLWKWMNPVPQGNTLKYVKVFSATDWIATGIYGTFMKTTNAGANWFITNNTQGTVTTYQSYLNNAYFFNMNTGVVCGVGGQIWRTTNGGLKFDSLPSGTNHNLYGMHFIDSNTGYIGGDSGTVLKTTNSGVNWFKLKTGNILNFYNVYALGSRVYLPSYTGSVIYTSYDAGTNWFYDTVAAEQEYLYDVAFKDSLTGVVCGINYIAATSNGGQNWTPYNINLNNKRFYKVLFNNYTWYLVGDKTSLFKSTNNGISWDTLNFIGNQYYSFEYYSLDINGSTFLTCGVSGLMNYSTNYGSNWISLNYMGNYGIPQDIWCDNMNGKVIVVGAAAPSPFIISTNGGQNWIFNVYTDSLVSYKRINMLNSNTGYCCGNQGKVSRTTNGGFNWAVVSAVIPGGYDLYSLDFVNYNTGYVTGSSNRIYKTTDGGNTWITQALTNLRIMYSIDMINADTGCAVGAWGVCLYTNNGGVNWVEQKSFSNSVLNTVKMLNSSTGYLSGGNGILRKTTNGGKEWDTVFTPISINFRSISFSDINTGYAAGENCYTLRTSNGGLSWEANNSGSPIVFRVYCKGYDSAFICGGAANVLKLFNPLTGGITWHHDVPTQYSLEQNYPNPFNPSTSINFAIPNTGKVNLIIYDILGREVVRPVDNLEMNAGTVSYNFEASNLSSGVYFYSLIVNNKKIDTKRMVLLK